MGTPPPPETGSQPPSGDSDDSIDDLARSVTDGQPVDWAQAETSARSADDIAQVRGLHELARVAEYHRRLQRSPSLDASLDRPAGTIAASAPEQWGHLTLLQRARSGASGEVWQAWDAWLQREVALKFLLTSGAAQRGDADDSKLLEEARALARVRHPGVVAVHGIGEHAGRVGMWMDLLHGKTLEMEIDQRGALPPAEVARIGLELCHALEAVESAELVHRDIKPANIILETSGRVVLTDFGLGRRLAIEDPKTWRASGTPLFMAPEVLAGEPATARSDLYALGVTLRWALTGHTPFKARALEELEAEAASGPATPLSVECPAAPGILVQAIERAMAPRAETRYGSATQFASDLARAEQQMKTPDAGAAKRPWRWIAVAATFAAALAIGITAIVMQRIQRAPMPSIPVRFSVSAPPNTTLVPNANGMAVSPDGRLLAFVAVDSMGSARLWVRPFASHAARPIEGTENAFGPFWSPDSRSLGFFADTKLKKVLVSGGAPEILCATTDPRGGSWGSRGVIVFAPVATGPICRISEQGGEVTAVVRPDSSRGELALRWPEFLPDGNHFMFVSLPPRTQNFDIYVGSIDSPDRKRVMTSGAAPVCAGDAGFILASNGRLMVQRFDYRRLEPVGEPLALGAASSSDQSVGQRLASASMNGVLAQPTASLANTRLVWLDRSGREQGTVSAPTGRYEKLVFSPDGRRVVAVKRTSPNNVDLWMVDLEGGHSTRFTSEPQSRIGGVPAWSPDGRRVAFSSNRSGPTNIYQMHVEATGAEEPLYQTSALFKETKSWSHDGRFLVFELADAVTSWDLWLLPMEGERRPIPYLRSKFGEVAGYVSPDGGWMSYSSDQSGRSEVYVRSFPKPGPEYQVTRQGGLDGLWSNDGKEMLIMNRWLDNAVWSVAVSTTPTFHAEPPRLLFRVPADVLWVQPTPDGERFLAAVPASAVEPPTIAVDLNWPAEIGAGQNGR